MMGKAIENKELKQRWEDETSERKDSVAKFIKDYFESRKTEKQAANEEIKDYDSFVELHFSGLNINILPKIKTGEAEPKQVDVYYNGDEIERMHILYDSGGKGHNIDVYLKGKAIEDYLKVSEVEED